MQHVTDPPAYDKTPNPSPIDLRKKAQDLMNAAENQSPVTIAVGPLTDAALAAKIMGIPTTPDCCAAASPRPLGEAGQETYLAVKLPNLPEGTTVIAQQFTVERGLAAVLVQLRADSLTCYEGTDSPVSWWAIRPITHEGFRSSGAGQTVPFLDALEEQRFESIEQAVAYAVKWLDALDAWFEAIEAATANIAETINA